MVAEHVHYALIMATRDVVKAFSDDLFVHDLTALKALEDRCLYIPSFLHIAYDTGTILDVFYPIGDYPYGNKKIPYLFGSANKYELLESVGYSLLAHVQSDSAIMHYYNGIELQLVSRREANDLLGAYKRNMYQRLIEREAE